MGDVINMDVRVRYAPSPTGFMHVGNLRSALYNYLIAKSLGGKFILRIEDTDQKRKIEGSEKIIFDTLKETGLVCDEGPNIGGNFGPYTQSERKEIYNHYASLLIDNGNAYYCFCEKSDVNTCKCRDLDNDKVTSFKSSKTVFFASVKVEYSKEWRA